MGTRYTNSDGLVQHYGTRRTENEIARKSTNSVRETLVIPFTYDNLPGYDADASGGSTADSFSGQIGFIPANSIITSVYLVSTTAWTGTATVDIGLEEQDGTVIDADCFYDGIDVDAATGLDTVGNVLQPNGNGPALNTSGTVDIDFNNAVAGNVDMYVRVINADAGTLTAGAATLIVEYIDPKA